MSKSDRQEQRAEAARPAAARKPALLEELVNRVIQEAQDR